MTQDTIGVLVGNRGFFPGHLCNSGREQILRILKKKGIRTICLSEKDTKYGSVETWEDAKKCAALFKKESESISGILVTLPNFGDEKGIADTLRLANLHVPVLIHAWPDDLKKMGSANRRDSFCGKISACDILRQYRIPFTLTSRHTMDPTSELFQNDLETFIKTCRAVSALKNLRLGAIGTRPNPFKTVRYSEKILEQEGISIEVMDMSDLFLGIEKISNSSKKVKEKVRILQEYIPISQKNLKKEFLTMAKLAIVIEEWLEENDLKGFAFQCWSSIQYTLGVMPCSVLSIFSNNYIPGACETDVTNLIGMYLLQQTSHTPSAVADWNNNYKDEPNKAVLFHCSNFPASMLKHASMNYQTIITADKAAFGCISGHLKPGPFTYIGFTTDDPAGDIIGYLGEGTITKDTLNTFGGVGVAEIPGLERLLNFICHNGFEHHVTINLSQSSRAIYEALTNYKGWEIYAHEPCEELSA
ncbi:MAG: L-fucose/L-arabinose isomerase family protein [Candidatus Ratteibacteria bacterium]|jgi:L-fucose isomerase-like protein